MPTQRPFFANFFSAFRARSTPGPFQAKSSTTTGAITPSALSVTAHISNTATTGTSVSSPRNITTKTSPDSTAQNGSNTTSQPIKNASTSPFATTAIAAGSPGTTFYRRPPSPGPHSHNLAMSPPTHSTPIARGRQRRDSGSSNSSGGFIDAVGPDKWYVGGRTATGEERFYQLGMVTGNGGKHVRSLDRLSL